MVYWYKNILTVYLNLLIKIMFYRPLPSDKLFKINLQKKTIKGDNLVNNAEFFLRIIYIIYIQFNYYFYAN